MNVTKGKKKLIAKLSSIGTTITLLLIQCNQCFAESIEQLKCKLQQIILKELSQVLQCH